MIDVARNAGAFAAGRLLCRTALALLLLIPGPALLAAEVRLLHANPSAVRTMLLERTAGEVEQTLQVQFEAGGRVHTLHLRPNRRLGQLGIRVGDRAQAYQGSVGAESSSWAALTRTGNRWSGMWYDGGEYFGVDTAGALAGTSAAVAALDPRSLVVYRLRDALWEDLSLEADTRPAAQTGAQLAGQLKSGLVQLPLDGGQRELKVAMVADARLSAQDGAAVETNLLAQLNLIDGLFRNQLGVRIAADSVTVYTSAASEPFSDTTEPDQLLGEISAWRADNAGQRAAGLTHVFTGRNLAGRTVGMAYVNSLCSRRYSASLSQATTAVSFAALIAAHEIAHVFGAPHDGDAAGACATTPTDYLMSPRINGSQQFSACSVAQMTPQVQAASCLTLVPEAGVVDEEEMPATGGGGGALPGWLVGMLLLLSAACRRQRQMRANHAGRSSVT